MKKIFILIAFIAISSCKGQESAKTTIIGIEALKTEVIGKDVQLIDVRTPKEYNLGHIDDAINIDISDKENFKKQISKLNTKEPIYIYCHSGGRSNRASKILEELSFTTIYDFSGGWKAWSKQLK